VRVAVTLGVVDDESQVRFDQLFERGLVVLLDAPAELFFTLRRQLRDLRDFLEILIQEIV